MKKVVCAVTAVVMLALCFALYSCEKQTVSTEPQESEIINPKNTTPASVVGTWTTKVSAAGFLFPKENWDSGSREWIDNEISLSLYFSEGGTIVLGLSKPDVREFLKNNVEAANAMYGYTVEEAMEEGKFETEDEMVEAMIDGFTYLNKTGTYTFSNGVLKTELISTAHTHGKDDAEEVPAEIRVAGNTEQL
ncbi:MAG: hypothetical protein IKG80_07980, partial [Clostridia bacterium]|nr:hypothetical protein [Clostridia bacterium]